MQIPEPAILMKGGIHCTMHIQQCLDSLLAEVQAVLATGKLAPERQVYFEGARDYLSTLRRLASPGSATEKKPRKPRSGGQNASSAAES